MKDKDFLKILLEDDWILKRISESHHILEKNGEILIVSVHGKDIKKGLWNSQIAKLMKMYGIK